MKKHLTVLALGITISACGPSRTADVTGLTGDAANGATLYGNHCAGCHGADGRSGSANKDIASEVGSDGAEVIDTMINGEGEMPSFAGTLSDQEMADIVSHLQTL